MGLKSEPELCIPLAPRCRGTSPDVLLPGSPSGLRCTFPGPLRCSGNPSIPAPRFCPSFCGCLISYEHHCVLELHSAESHSLSRGPEPGEQQRVGMGGWKAPGIRHTPFTSITYVPTNAFNLVQLCHLGSSLKASLKSLHLLLERLLQFWIC